MSIRTSNAPIIWQLIAKGMKLVSIHGAGPETFLSKLLERIYFGFSPPWGGRGLSAAQTDLG